MSGGWLAQLTPKPTTTAKAGSLSPSIKMPASLSGPSSRSFGHLSLNSGPSGGAQSHSASCSASAATNDSCGAKGWGDGSLSSRLA